MPVPFAFIFLGIILLTGKAAVSAIEQQVTKGDSCPNDWMLNPTNGRCYFISNQYARFDVAAKRCEAMSSSLASILSLEEQTFLLPVLHKERINNSNFWLGLRNRSPDRNVLANWTWIDRSPFSNRLSFWGGNFPSGKYDCGSLSTAQNSTQLIGYWEDKHCDKILRYICKKAVNGNMFMKQLGSTYSHMADLYFKALAQPTATALNCPTGWFTVPPFISCFYLGKDELPYNMAAKSCKSKSSVIAKLHSVDELKSVANWIALERNTCLYYEVCSQFWIGLRFANVSGKPFSSWIWSDGTSIERTENILTIASFGSETPSNKFEQCAAMNVGDGSEPSYAVVNDCRKARRYLCRADLVCPEGFFPVPEANSCYKLVTEVMNWTDASKACQNISPGTHLANILNQAENDAVIAFMEAEIYSNPSACRSFHTGFSPNAWIGAERTQDSCSKPFVWKLSDKVQIPLNYTYWFHNQPSCDHGIEYCLHITQIWDYQWNDHRCNETKCALCQKRF